jgi:hypothetical protein
MPVWPEFWTFVLTVRTGGRIVRCIFGRLLVGCDVAFVVAQNDLVVRGADLVIGHNGNLAAAAGRVHNKLRNRIARGVAAQPSMISMPLATGVRK